MYGLEAEESVQQPVIAIYVLWLIWFLSWLGMALLGTGIKRLTLAQDVLYRTLLLVAGVTLLFGFLPDPGFDVRNKFWLPLSATLGWVLVGVVLVMFCVAWWARITRGFVLPGSSRKPEPFVDRGPYRLVRHPIYVCLIIAALATAFVFGRPSSVGGAALLAVAFLIKILFEESALRRESSAFDDYAERVPMLVPFLKSAGEHATTPSPAARSLEAMPASDLRFSSVKTGSDAPAETTPPPSPAAAARVEVAPPAPPVVAQAEEEPTPVAADEERPAPAVPLAPEEEAAPAAAIAPEDEPAPTTRPAAAAAQLDLPLAAPAAEKPKTQTPAEDEASAQPLASVAMSMTNR